MSRNNSSIIIVADDREKKSGIPESLAKLENVSLRIRRLSVGDYQIENRLTVERKTLQDFAVSIIDGRLFSQMIRLAKCDSRGVCIIEGTSKDIRKINMSRAAMQGALITISIILGIPVLRSTRASETARLMLFMARQMRLASRNIPSRSGYQPKSNRKRRLFILQGLPGIGRERAIRLLEYFHSVEAVITADSAELQEVPGIGEHIAGKIRRAVT